MQHQFISRPFSLLFSKLNHCLINKTKTYLLSSTIKSFIFNRNYFKIVSIPFRIKGREMNEKKSEANIEYFTCAKKSKSSHHA